MFNKLKKKWKVNWIQFILIFCTFAIGGSMCGFAGKKLLGLFNLQPSIFYYILYILLVTLLWPICVIIISIPLGQFVFFKNYITRIKNRIF